MNNDRRSVLQMLSSPNPVVWWVIGGTLGALVSVLYVPYLRTLFQFAELRGQDLLLSLAAAGAGLLWFELYKLLRFRRV